MTHGPPVGHSLFYFGVSNDINFAMTEVALLEKSVLQFILYDLKNRFVFKLKII